MDGAEAQELRIREAGNHAEDALLLGNAKPRLEPDEIPHPAGAIFLPELRDGVRLTARPRVAQPHGLERAEAEHIAPALCHHFHRETPLEVRHLVEVVPPVLIRRQQRVDERLVLLARERAIDVRALVGATLDRLLSVPRRPEHDRLVDRVVRDDGRDRVEEGEPVDAEARADGLGEGVGRERTGGDDRR